MRAHVFLVVMKNFSQLLSCNFGSVKDLVDRFLTIKVLVNPAANR
jgi:hypothetical protein